MKIRVRSSGVDMCCLLGNENPRRVGVISTFTRGKRGWGKGVGDPSESKKGARGWKLTTLPILGTCGKGRAATFISLVMTVKRATGNTTTGGPRMKERPSS
ncbi:unnamed protein product [Ectocarpus sp. 6 AP-2014]